MVLKVGKLANPALLWPDPSEGRFEQGADSPDRHSNAVACFAALRESARSNHNNVVSSQLHSVFQSGRSFRRNSLCRVPPDHPGYEQGGWELLKILFSITLLIAGHGVLLHPHFSEMEPSGSNGIRRFEKNS